LVPFVFVLTRVKPNTLITAQAAAILSKHGQGGRNFRRRPHRLQIPLCQRTDSH
jgi:hypothetical protein